MKLGRGGSLGCGAARAQWISTQPVPSSASAPNCSHSSFPYVEGSEVVLAVPWCGVSFSAVNVALGDGSLFHVCVVVWFRWLNFSVMLCWRSFSLSLLFLSPFSLLLFLPLFLQVFLLELMMGPPWELHFLFQEFLVQCLRGRRPG